ncbi:hypothetical protein LOK46_25580 [Methylobacterium sp. NMS14P]|uniref:hypothetical protein n=1 Tax=Methylobacterium sp. NMS14P TaxID=2894310 RepID=UPI0023598C7A|nr:hypothetical protein [Methylobacterium sp. NMS14P]WCS24466.1 hypothetical protein LOK46_25580 [Methylobacterium sp. NMS14P]
MEDWRLVMFAIFMVALVAVGWGLLQRRRRAARTGDDAIYGVASLTPETIERQHERPRARGTGTTGE